ncbi:MAG: tRNA-dihydrouridine synthase family protein [Acidobacteriota bacterium]|nr:tRNA-dihydrouridine synthase family protein [Acidobacteriota bacterium]
MNHESRPCTAAAFFAYDLSENKFCNYPGRYKVYPFMNLQKSLDIDGKIFAPALFLAPMAGVTHSAFRRLVSDFGGYGALTTEMLSATAFFGENPAVSPFSRRRDCEGPVVYQLRTSGEDILEAAILKLEAQNPAAIDLNLGCPAPEIQKQASGAALFRDFERLRHVLSRVRAVYRGTLFVKCRLGDPSENWRAPFVERLRLFEDYGVNAVTVHPRFSNEKLKRRARWREFPWIAAQTRLPVIGNGDIRSLRDVLEHSELFEPLAGLMLGRIAAQKPWIFREFSGLQPLHISHAEIWDRLCRYTLEDFPPEKAIGRLKEFTAYFAQNFFFGHELFRESRRARNIEELRASALNFLESGPQLSALSV